MDNKSKKITCTAMEKTNSRQFIIVIRIIITTSVVHFPNELKIKTAHSFPTGLAITNLSKLSPTKPTTFSRLIETKLLKFSQNLQSLSLSLCQNFSMSLQIILNQYALILSKQTLICSVNNATYT